MAALEQLVTQLVADTRDWSRGLQVAQVQLTTFERQTGTALTRIGGGFARLAPLIGSALSVAGLVAFAQSAIETADAVGDLSAAAGLSAEAFQRYQHALSFSGVSASEFSSAMTTATRVTGGFIEGQERAVKAFRMLGISASDQRVKLMSQDEVLRLLIDRLSSYGSHAERVAAAARIFGESVGPKLVAFAEQGGTAIDGLLAQAVVFSDEQTRLAAEVNDAWQRVTSEIGVRLKGATLDALNATGLFVQGFDLSTVNNKIAETIRALEDLKAELADKPEDKVLLEARGEMLSKRLEELQAAQRQRLREQRANSPEEREKNLREGDERRDRERAEEQAARDAKRRAEDIERGRKQAKEASYRAEEKAELERFEREVLKGREEERAAKDRELDKILELERAERERFETMAKSAADVFADVATNGEAAWDRLKQRALASIAEIAIKWAAAGIFGPAPGQDAGASNAGIFGQVLAGVLGMPAHARGGRPMTGIPAIVGERGPELFVPQTAGTIVPAGRFSLGGGGSQTHVSLGVEVSIEPGMSATQERRRGIDGRERVLVAVRSANAEDVSRRGPLSRMIAAETGQRAAPRKGIS